MVAVRCRTVPLRGEEYDARFARLSAEGRYLHGEADLVTSLVGPPPRRILDAGCGTGRVALELATRGYEVVGMDVEASMLDVARTKAPELTWVLGDLARDAPPGGPYDMAVAAGNVMIFVQLGTEAAVVGNLARVLRPRGLLLAGFQLGRQLPIERYDELCRVAGLDLVERWATWERQPYGDGDYAVSLHRRSEEP
jgi:ubiquinone/menaquinone biosynthesis C-methylase UbiE